MPLPVIRAYVTMLVRLEAEDAINVATQVAVGTGSILPADRDRLFRAWHEAAGDRAKPIRPTSRAGLVAFAAGAGIGIEVAPAEPRLT